MFVPRGHHQQFFLPLESPPDASSQDTPTDHPISFLLSQLSMGEVGSGLPSINSGLGLTDLTSGGQVCNEAR